MAEIFKKNIRVMEYECGLEKSIRLSGIMHHAQQMGSDHLATKHVDYRQMYQDGMVFVVNKMKINIMRRPEFNEELLLTTIPKKAKGVQFIRDTMFDTVTGEKLVNVSISWALINPETRKILRPAVFDKYEFEFNSNDGEMITGYKIKRIDGEITVHQRQVKYSDLDYNGHVNNSVYADMICDLLPVGILEFQEIESFGIIYHKEAKFGNIMEIEEVCGENSWYFNGKIGDERCFEAEICFYQKKAE